MERVADAICLSLSLFAIISQLLFFINIPISPLIAFAFLMAVMGIASLKRMFGGEHPEVDWANLLPTFAFMIGVISWRVFQARELAFPAWVDSPHHALIVRAIIENNGLPETLNPYIDMPFYYHFGFHAYIALACKVFNLSLEQTILIMGQIINASISFSVYRLGKSLWKNRILAFACALLVSLVSSMPGYYLSWGRYSLLTGLMILPVIMAMISDHRCLLPVKRGILLIAILTTGIFLSHYFAGLLLLSFLVLFLIVPRKQPTNDRLWLGIPFGIIAASPWLFRSLRLITFPIRVSFNGWSTSTSGAGMASINHLADLLGSGRGHLLLLGGIIGGCIIYRKETFRPLVLWSALLLLLSLPLPFHINRLRPDHFAIVVFIPLIYLFTAFVHNAITWAMGKLYINKYQNPILLLTLAILSIWGLIETANIVNPLTILAVQDDLTAITWIGEHTSQDAKILIQADEWQGGVYRPVDGGGWITAITGRETVVPPITYGFGDRKLIERITSQYVALMSLSPCSADYWEALEDLDISYIYQNTARSTSTSPWPPSQCASGGEYDEGHLSRIFQIGNVILYHVEN